MDYIIEIATADFETTRSAVEGGADRIELCAALSEGGITPSAGTILKCREKFGVQLFPIIRPRGGDFLYTDEEFAIMLADVKKCREYGCDGVVSGFLHRDGTVDAGRMEKLVAAAFPMEVTFHRAFDRCRDPFEAMELLITLGCQRILTSGQQPTAPQGAALIAQLVQQSSQRIIIMPGSGVRSDNIADIAKRTGAAEFHSSLRSRAASLMEFVHPAFAESEESFTRPHIDPQEVRALRLALG